MTTVLHVIRATPRLPPPPVIALHSLAASLRSHKAHTPRPRSDIMGIEASRRCLEIDLFEGNVKAARSTLHTRAGEASDGTCNQVSSAIALIVIKRV